MNERLKSTLKYTSVFLLGLLVGTFLIESLEIQLRPAYRNIIIRTDFKTEQEFLASRAARENRRVEAAFHRWAVVNAESDDGFRVFQEHHDELNGQQYSYLLSVYILKLMSSDDNIKRGQKIAEGFDRGKLAAALETIGQKAEAETQWQLAQVLTGRKNIEETKKSVYSMLGQEKSDIYLKAESKILGPTEK